MRAVAMKAFALLSCWLVVQLPLLNAQVWSDLHNEYVREMNEIRQRGGNIDLVFYGDSITECWRGSSLGQPIPRADGIPEVWRADVLSKYTAITFGIGGQNSTELLWRLQNGEAPHGVQPKVIVVLIGTNDIAHKTTEEEMMDTIQPSKANQEAIVQTLQEAAPGATVVLMANLPRGPYSPNAQIEFDQPSVYTKYFQVLNNHKKSIADARDHCMFVDCGAQLLDSEGNIDPALVPDGTHPNADGMRIVFRCLDQQVLKNIVH